MKYSKYLHCTIYTKTVLNSLPNVPCEVVNQRAPSAKSHKHDIPLSSWLFIILPTIHFNETIYTAQTIFF